MRTLSHIASIIESQGRKGLVDLAIRHIVKPKAKCRFIAQDRIRGKFVIEIGGLSEPFTSGGMMPLYPHIRNLQNWNPFPSQGDCFAECPVNSFPFDGFTSKPSLPVDADAIISCHALEHTANPLQALVNWKSFLHLGGHLILVVPDRAKMFDHRRPLTTFGHLLRDFADKTPESDRTHFHELVLYDVHAPGFCPDLPFYHLSPDSTWLDRLKDNTKWRYFHHHTFDEQLTRQCVNWAGYRLICSETVNPFHIVVLAQLCH